MSSTSRNVRTYSRRQSLKNSAAIGIYSPDRGGRNASSSQLLQSDDNNERPTKRSRTLLNEFNDRNERDNPLSGNMNQNSSLPMSPSNDVDLTRMDKVKGRAVSGYSISRLDESPAESKPSTSRPSTPKKPKDLSGIFDAVSPQRRTHSQANTPSKSGIKKRMLSRSRTESSIESSPSRASKFLPKSQSLVLPEKAAVADRSPSRSPDKQLSRSLSRASITPGSQQSQRESANNHRTYAGTSRSFLVALPARALLGEPGLKQNSLDEDDEEYLRDSYAELRKRFGVDNSDNINGDHGDAESAGEGLALYNPLSSITDLRSKGESRRFRDEVGYLFEGLEPAGALSVRRSSAIDIVSNLNDTEFWKKAKAAGLILEIWERFRDAGAGNGDKILDPVLCCFVALASEDPRDMVLLASREDFVPTIVQLMVTHAIHDPFAPIRLQNGAKLGKAETMMLGRLRDIMASKTSIVHKQCQASTRLLLSCGLASAPSLAFPHINVVLDSTVGDLISVSTRLSAHQSGLALFTDKSHEKLCLEHIYNCLAILDLYLIEAEAVGSAASLSKTELRQRYRALPSGLVALLVIADIVSRHDSSEALGKQASRCSDLAFRVLINLTNGSATWADAITADPYTLPTLVRTFMTSHRSLLSLEPKKHANGDLEPDGDALTSPMDRLCLALALLTNLMQERDNLAHSLRNTTYDTACDGRRACLLGCRCASGINCISALVNMYVSFLKSDDEETAPDIHFLQGHLAILVGLLILQLDGLNEDVPVSPAHSIIDALPGPSDSARRKLEALIGNVDAFSHLYASLTSRTLNRDGRSEARAEGRGGGGSEDSDSVQRWNGVESDVVAGVAASLRALCSSYS